MLKKFPFLGILSVPIGAWIGALYPLWWTIVGSVGARVSILITSTKRFATISARIPLIVITTFTSTRCIRDRPDAVFSLTWVGSPIGRIVIIIIRIGISRCEIYWITRISNCISRSIIVIVVVLVVMMKPMTTYARWLIIVSCCINTQNSSNHDWKYDCKKCNEVFHKRSWK